MMLISMLSWWYTAGWAGLATRIGRRIARLQEAFSVSLLAGSLFEPFRQISTGQAQGRGIDAQLRAWGDRMFSRAIGAVARSLFILMGLVGICIVAVIGLVQLALWPVLPFFPLIGAVLALLGVTL